MPTKRRKTDFSPAAGPLSTRELLEVLVKHYGISEGKYELAIEFAIATGPVGPNAEEMVPGVVFGVRSVALAAVETDTATSVDAARLAPPEAARKSRAKKIPA